MLECFQEIELDGRSFGEKLPAIPEIDEYILDRIFDECFVHEKMHAIIIHSIAVSFIDHLEGFSISLPERIPEKTIIGNKTLTLRRSHIDVFGGHSKSGLDQVGLLN